MLYEVLLPFLTQRPLPSSLALQPPPPQLRRLRARNGDPTRVCAAMECGAGLLLLQEGGEEEVRGVELLACYQMLRSCTAQLGAMVEQPEVWCGRGGREGGDGMEEAR